MQQPKNCKHAGICINYFSASLRPSLAPENSASSQGNCYRSCPASAWPNCGTASATTSLTNCHPGVSHVPKTAMLSHCFHDVSSPQNASLAKRCMPQGFQCGVSRIRTTPTYFQNLRLRQVREGHLKWRVPKPMVCLSQPH